MGRHRILIVEDQREVRRMLRSALETLEPDIVILDVPSGEEAMLLVSIQSFDLLIADVNLPGISGLELKKQAKLYNPDLKWILITGLTDPEIRKEVASAGADAYFFKPVVMPDFLDTVGEFLDLSIAPEDEAPESNLENEAAPVVSIAERLSAMRQALKADVVMLLDERGKAMAQAGQLTDGLDSDGLPAACMAALSASAKVSHAVGAPAPRDLHYFAGSSSDLYLAHVGSTAAFLLAALPHDEQPDLGKISAVLHPAVQDLSVQLGQMGLAPLDTPLVSAVVEAVVEEEELEDDGALAELDALFQKAEGGIVSGDVDAFWDAAAQENDPASLINADALTYEQARKLGLAPDEEE